MTDDFPEQSVLLDGNEAMMALIVRMIEEGANVMEIHRSCYTLGLSVGAKHAEVAEQRMNERRRAAACEAMRHCEGDGK